MVYYSDGLRTSPICHKTMYVITIIPIQRFREMLMVLVVTVYCIHSSPKIIVKSTVYSRHTYDVPAILKLWSHGTFSTPHFLNIRDVRNTFVIQTFDVIFIKLNILIKWTISTFKTLSYISNCLRGCANCSSFWEIGVVLLSFWTYRVIPHIFVNNSSMYCFAL